jgi:hypothetical protein
MRIAWLAVALLFPAGAVPSAEPDSLGWKLEKSSDGSVTLADKFADNSSLTLRCASNEDSLDLAIYIPYSEEIPAQDLTIILMPNEAAYTFAVEVESHGNKAYSVKSRIEKSSEIVSALRNTDMIAFFGGLGGSGFLMEPKMTDQFLSECPAPRNSKAL